jgi:hypothetical protein
MAHDYPSAILSNHEGDYRAAYEFLAKAYRSLDRQFTDTLNSRFFEVSRFESDSEVCLRQITESSISSAVDMADCQPDFVMRKWFYVDDAGEIHPVKIGRQERFSNGVEQPFYFAASAIVANGQQVGEVVYTDH